MSQLSWWTRLSGEMETVGVLPVPDSQRTMTSGKMFNVWAMASASAMTPLIGMLLFQYGLTDAILAIVIGWLIGVVPAGLFSEMGRETPLTALIVARKTYGLAGSFLLAILFTFVNVGWFGLNTEVGGQILSSIFHSSGSIWFWLIGIIQIVLVLFGMKWLEYFYRYTSVLLIVCYGALAIYLFTHFSITYPVPTAPMNWGGAITIVVSFSILAWTYKLSTVSRFCVPKDRTGSSFSYFLAPSAGVMLPVLLMGIVGIYSQRITGNWNVALLGPHIPIWGLVAAIGVALAIIHTNAMNLYPSTVDLLVAMNTVHKPFRWEQPLATVVLGMLSILLAVGGILNRVSGFLDMVGDVVIPFTFVLIVDWLWVQKKSTPSGEFFSSPRTSRDWISWTAIVSFLIGFVVSFWGNTFLPGFFYNTLPLPVVGGLVGALLYLLLEIRNVRKPTSAGMFTPSVEHEE